MSVVTPYAKLLVSINGGALTSGGITIPSGAVVAFAFENTIGWEKYRLEMLPPPDGAIPAGWANEDGLAVYTGTVAPPPAVTFPLISSWGKWPLTLIVNDGAGVVTTDSDTLLSMVSTNGFVDVAPREGKQMSALRAWAGAIQTNLRLIDAALGNVAGKTHFDHDYAADPTLTAFTGGPVTLGDGKLWNYQKQNTPPNRQVTNGQGIVLGGATGSYGTLTCPLQSLAPLLTFLRKFVIDIRMTHTVSAHDYLVGLTDASLNYASPGTTWNGNGAGLLARQGYSSGSMVSLWKYGATGDTSIYSDTFNATDDVFRFVVDGPSFLFQTSLWQGAWPADSNFTRRGAKYWTQTTSENVTNANLGIVLGTGGPAGSASGLVTISNIRVREL